MMPRSGKEFKLLEKSYVKSRQVSKVVFALPRIELPEGVKAESVSLVGEFNDWDPTAMPMKLGKSKASYRATVELEPSREYQFRYLVNGEQWLNDQQADGYAPNGYGDNNCVVLTAAAPSAPKQIQDN
jgi:hypothetical protein